MKLCDRLNAGVWRPRSLGRDWTLTREDPAVPAGAVDMSDDPVLKNTRVYKKTTPPGPVIVAGLGVGLGEESAWYNPDHSRWYDGQPPTCQESEVPVVRVHTWRVIQVATILLCLCVKFEVVGYGSSYADFRFPAGIHPAHMAAIERINNTP